MEGLDGLEGLEGGIERRNSGSIVLKQRISRNLFNTRGKGEGVVGDGGPKIWFSILGLGLSFYVECGRSL